MNITILELISLSLIAVCGVFAAARHIMMYQQSSYYFSRYFGWLKTALSVRSLISALLFAASVLAVVFDIYWILIAVAVLSLFRIKTAFADNKKAIKKLVFTARIKRLFVTYSLVTAGVILLAVFVGRYFVYLSLVLSFANPIALVISGCINIPIEKIGAQYYINDAKKILKSHKNLKVIGVTGSYGKTSSKFILARILSEKFNVVATPESFNTPMGVVRTVRERLTPPTEIFIAEMGAKKKGDIKEVCKIANPDTALVTTVGPQHLDTFGNIETVLSTKLELADWVSKKGGRIYLNADNEYLSPKIKEYQNCFSFGENENADCRAENITYTSKGLTFDIVKGDISFTVSTSLLGRHNAQNIASAAAIALDLGESPKDIAYAISTLRAPEHRLELKHYLNGSLLIDDAYNSNPSGCLSAVEVLSKFEGMTKIIVTPGLVELGDKEYEYNKALGAAAAKVCDKIILVGKKRSVPLKDGALEQGYDEEKLTVVDRFKDAAAMLATLCDNNTVVLFENDLPDNYAG
ncbi:MAG: UDP-N-acetylmuramoyl-tripeptide--D-alanyl-D-alanine ligase [Clostridia bacterium]|nr:UDP-N-acetylmuramoyl-tripeptide--D-alanyl-D-alanine ligase [Clostridia bacterium]